jgi:tetratricopeptide (TPR) repeat protein
VSTKSGPFNLGQSLNEALSLHRQGQFREAEKIYTRVLKAAPDNFDALNLLGSVKAQLGHMGEAHRLFRAAVKANARAPQGWSNLGQSLRALKRPQEALECFDKARSLAPDDADILYQHANALLSLGRGSDALGEFQALLARLPQHVEARVDCGHAQAVLGFHERALAEFDRALALDPRHPLAHYNRGVALIKLARYAEALAANDSALAVVPGHANAWLNRGRALTQLNRLGEAIASYDKVIALRKDHADAHFNAALAHLASGDYRRGFEAFEWRWRRTGMTPQKSRGRPLWLGEYPLARKTILLHAEQGLGDTIQFVRYLPRVAAAGAKIVLEVQAGLKTLMTLIDGAATVIAPGDAPPAFDVHCPLGSLPLAFKTEPDTVPAQVPYLTADETHLAKWSARLAKLPRPRIAIAWSGNASHDNDRNRSLAFERLGPLFSSLNPPPQAGEGRVEASFVSIQRDVRSEDLAALAGEHRVTHVGDDLEDFSDTAAVLALCDLVITVDTAVAHLAGAMGRPVWVLVPFAPDWRWGLQGDTTPWYPTARLFRQSALGDWDSVIASVGGELARFGTIA